MVNNQVKITAIASNTIAATIAPLAAQIIAIIPQTIFILFSSVKVNHKTECLP